MHEVQKEKMKEGLNKAISSDNKGFALLSKMGYKAGTSLGLDNQTGIKEPIKISMQSEGRLGLGTQTAIREVREKQINNLKRKIKASDMTTEEYRNQMREVSEKKQVVWDLHKLQRTCRLLDMDSRVKSPIHSWFWPESKDDSKDKDHDDDTDDEPKEKKNELTVRYFSCSLINF